MSEHCKTNDNLGVARTANHPGVTRPDRRLAALLACALWVGNALPAVAELPAPGNLNPALPPAELVAATLPPAASPPAVPARMAADSTTFWRLPSVVPAVAKARPAGPVHSMLVEDLDRRLSDLKRQPGDLAPPELRVSALPSAMRDITQPDSQMGSDPVWHASSVGSALSSATQNAAYVTGQPQLLPSPPAEDIDSLRSELRQAISRLDAAQRQMVSAQQPGNGGDAPPSGGGGDRLSTLESAFDRFEDQMTAERAAKFPSARLTGFTQLDDYIISQDPLNKATVGNAQNGLGFRRARLAVVGNVAALTAYMMEVDFATAGRPSFFDMWVEQDRLPVLGALRVGQYLQPFSADAMSGFRHLPFLERSLPFLAFVPFRRVGAMSSINTQDERTYFAYSLFRTGGFNNAPEGDSRFATDIGDQGGLSFSARLTNLLIYDPNAEDQYLWHVGASYNYSRMTGNTASGAQPFYQARTGPEFGPIGDGIDTVPATFGPVSYAAANFTPPSFIDSGRYLADSFNLFGVETVYQYEAFSAQAEFMATGVNSVVGPIWYTGAYGEVMYRLTGEHRGYDRRLASLKNPLPFTDFISLKPGGIRGWGAWEVAARLSYIEIRNPSSLLPADYIAGTNSSGNGTLTDTTVGMTWWWNYHTKLQFNWIHSMLNNAAMGYSLADSFVSRLQVDF
ncbi:MAG TPA: porin [Pirellulales bacterium]